MTRTVLIVDDHPSFRASARMLLEAEGYDVVGEAGNGHSGLQAAAELRRRHPSLSFRELAKRAEPAVTKAAMAGRLSRIVDLADDQREFGLRERS